MSFSDPKFKFIVTKIGEAAGLSNPSAAEDFLPERTLNSISDFVKGSGNGRLTFLVNVVATLQSLIAQNNSVLSASDLADPSGKRSVSVGAEKDLGSGRYLYFFRTQSSDKTSKDFEITFGEIKGSPIETLNLLLTEVYLPSLESTAAWGKCSDELVRDFISSLQKFTGGLTEAIKSMQSGVELSKPEKFVDIENRPASYTKAASEPEVLDHYESIMDEWCGVIDRILAEAEVEGGEDDLGPDAEIDFWKGRMGKLNSVMEQLKLRECRLVIGVVHASKSKLVKRWKHVDAALTDALNEAKIHDALPGLMNSLKMILSISRYYSSSDKMAALFVRITNQIIAASKKHLQANGKLWEQKSATVVASIQTCLRLVDAYQEQFHVTKVIKRTGQLTMKDKLMTQPKGKQFDFPEARIFGKLELFSKRLTKIQDMFSTIEQFKSLSAYKIDGMEPLVLKFFRMVDKLKQQPYDLLDYAKTIFDRDYLEYNVNVVELEGALQNVVNSSFESMTSTIQALNLLRRFESILQREALKSDLDAKYLMIFHNYGVDLEAVQQLYDKQKAAAPIPRNAPPVAGNIMWARQLMRRIEEPMVHFKNSKTIMNSREAKKIVKTYNRVARALVEFETLWQRAWAKSVETAKAGLQATLIIRHPRKQRLFVNFDTEILQLIREAKCLIRMGIDVPESAAMVVLQEEKFKLYFNQLSFALALYEDIVARIVPVVRPILRPHLEDLDAKFQPGMTILTWQSMNIDGYLHRVHTGLIRFDELVKKIDDLVNNRIEARLKHVSRTLLVDLPPNESFTLDQFITLQEKTIKKKTLFMAHRNSEIETAVTDLIDLVKKFPIELADAYLTEEEVNKLRTHYSHVTYLAILNATKSSFNALKRRLGSKQSGGFLFVERPFFDVDVELTIPNVSMNPSLDEIQTAINRCAIQVLKASKTIMMWSSAGQRASYYSRIAQDKEIVKAVLLLTGSIDGSRRQVLDYLVTFRRYDYLWRDDKSGQYMAFIRTGPDLDAFEAELRKYMNIEKEIASIPPVHNIGCMSLETQPLKYSLKSEASAWKSQFAKNLHMQAKSDLERLSEYMRDTVKRLDRKIEDLEDVQYIMKVMCDVRECEISIDLEIPPVEDKYMLLLRYDVRVPKEELEGLTDLRSMWRKVRKLTNDMAEKLSQLQSTFKKDLVKTVKNFTTESQQFRLEFDSQGPGVYGISSEEAYERVKYFQRVFNEKIKKMQVVQEGEVLFGFAQTHFPDMLYVQRELSLYDKFYSLSVNVSASMSQWKETLWYELVPQLASIADSLGKYSQELQQMPKAVREWVAFSALKTEVEKWTDMHPLLTLLGNRAMKIRHWQNVLALTGRVGKVDMDAMRLSTLLSIDVMSKREDVEEICLAAVKELQIELKLKQIAAEWADMNFSFATFKTRGPVLLKGSDLTTISERLEDAQTTLGSMATNKFSGPFKEEIMQWVTRLAVVADVLEQWVAVQSMWTYMEAVFSSVDITKQLPQEAKRFQQVDKNYMKIMAKAFETRNIIHCCVANDALRSLLPHLLEQLELCQRSLTGYLETKRNTFPRFAFVSDAVLLELLSQGANDAQVLQPHLNAMFDGVAQIAVEKGEKPKKQIITALISPEGETLPLISVVEVVGVIEEWMSVLLQSMQEAVKLSIRHTVNEFDGDTIENIIRQNPAQACVLALQAWWTSECQNAISRAKTEKVAMSNALRRIGTMLSDLVKVASQPLPPMLRTSVETLVTLHVHQRDVTEELVKRKTVSPVDFEWLRQCRVYWKAAKDSAVVSITDVDISYSFEYLGCKERLVMTPLTDRCYIVLTQALAVFQGGAPNGPAGTGKTETVKDLGRSLGNFVVVFNCSDQMDYRGVGRIVKGLAQSGTWGCFDEFNRIELNVLSVVSEQMLAIFSALRERRNVFAFPDGTSPPLDSRCAFFVTMNPGYAGRQELPENLKALFRWVTMMVPDREIIIRVRLAACGFQDNYVLARKFTLLYRLCEQQLSPQRQYDFGLRNILSVIRNVGAMRRNEADKPEAAVLCRIIRDMNVSKLVPDDVVVFLALLSDIFPSQPNEKAATADVEKHLEAFLKERSLSSCASFAQKVLQTFDSIAVRHGVTLTGATGAAKTTALEAAAHIFTATTQQKCSTIRINPKALPLHSLFGYVDGASGEWFDGVISSIWRRVSKQRNTNSWLVMDGPVDALWVENFNTVLDDNKLLTLANGDRLQMHGGMRLILENDSLENASPATVSRTSLVFFPRNTLTTSSLVAAWLERRRATEVQLLRAILQKSIEAALTFARADGTAVDSFGAVANILAVLGALLSGAAAEWKDTDVVAMERAVIYAILWGVGGSLNVDQRVRMEKTMRTSSIGDAMPDGGSAFDFALDSSFEWDRISSSDPSFASSAFRRLHRIILPTPEALKLDALFNLALASKRPILVAGDAGAGKSTIVERFLARLDAERTMTRTLVMSETLTNARLQGSLEAMLERRQGRLFGPLGGKTAVLFVDDCSLAQTNEWGDKPTLELVRQFLHDGGLYSLDKPGDWKQVENIMWIATSRQSGPSLQLPPRFLRNFHIVGVHLTAPTVDAIFAAPMRALVKHLGLAAQSHAIASRLVEATYTSFKKASVRHPMTPSNCFAEYGLAQLASVIHNVAALLMEVSLNEGSILNVWKSELLSVLGDRMQPAESAALLSDVGAIVEDVLGKTARKWLEDETRVVSYLKQTDAGTALTHEVQDRKAFAAGAFGRCIERWKEARRSAQIDVSLFTQFTNLLVSVSRALTTSCTSAMLVGFYGTGKRTALKCAAAIVGLEYLHIPRNATSPKEVIDYLKPFLKPVILGSKQYLLQVDEDDLKTDEMAQFFCTLLDPSDSMDIFAPEELDSISNEFREQLKKEKDDSPEASGSLKKQMYLRIREGFRIGLCVSSTWSRLHHVIGRFTAFLRCTRVIRVSDWTDEALQALTSKCLHNISDVAEVKTDPKLPGLFSQLHLWCVERSRTPITPGTFMYRLSVFEDFLVKHRGSMMSKLSQVNTGLTKMEESSEAVGRMKVELGAQEISLIQAQRAGNELLREITTSTMRAEKKRAEVTQVKNSLATQAATIQQDRDVCERDLEATKPALLEAEAALKTINQKDIQGLKALRNPPFIIKLIFDAVLVLRQRAMGKCEMVEDRGRKGWKDNYATSLAMMAEPSFLRDIVEFPRDRINDETIELVAPYVQSDDFTTEKAAKASAMAAGLCSWVRAMVLYQEASKAMKPKLDALSVAEAKLAQAKKKLDGVEGELRECQREVEALQDSFDGAMKQRLRLQAEAEMTKKRLEVANALINGLGDERERWKVLSKRLKEQLSLCVNDAVAAACFLAYAGCMSRQERDDLTRKAASTIAPVRGGGLSVDEPTTLFADDATKDLWALRGLPRDSRSVENGVLVTFSTRRWPLFVDPQGQMTRWLTNLEKERGVKSLRVGDKTLRAALEDAVQFGVPVVLEGFVGVADGIVEAIIQRTLVKVGRGYRLMLPDKELEFSDGFRLFVAARALNAVPAEFFGRLTVVDCAVTEGGLEEQLLSVVVLKERPEVEEQRRVLVREISSYQLKLAHLNDELLLRLSSTGGNLLDDASLVEVLSNTKAVAKDVSDKLRASSDAQLRIQAACDEYRPVAERAAIIFFACQKLTALSPLYAMPLQKFVQLFDAAIAASERASIPSKRIANVLDFVTLSFFNYIARGIFERHRVVFAALLAFGAAEKAGPLPPEALSFFTRTPHAHEPSAKRRPPFVSEPAWHLLLATAQSLPSLRDVPDALNRNEAAWRAWAEHDAPERQRLPDADDRIDPFARLLLLRAMREDRLAAALPLFISEVLGPRFVDFSASGIESAISDASPTAPLLLIVSPAADPSEGVVAHAKRRKRDLKSVAMGQGQEPLAKAAIQAAQLGGGWVLIQNAHISPHFLDDVDPLLAADNPSPDFLLLVTTDAGAKFPTPLLERCVRVTCEAAAGVRANLKRAYSVLPQETLDAVPRAEWRSVVFSLALLHAVAVERRRFVGCGWTAPYEFSMGDLLSSIHYAHNALLETDAKTLKDFQWAPLRVMVGEVFYGGRIVDDADAKAMAALCERHLGAQLLDPHVSFASGIKPPPPSSDIVASRAFVEALQHAEAPEVLGLTAQAEVATRLGLSQALLVALGGCLRVGGSETPHAQAQVLPIAQDLLAKLPKELSDEEIRERHAKVMGPGLQMAPLGVCLRFEMERIHRLVRTVRRNLQDVISVLTGALRSTPSIDHIIAALGEGVAPQHWGGFAPALGGWVASLLWRFDAVEKWAAAGRPKHLPVAALFNPYAIVGAVRQEVARRKTTWSLEDVVALVELSKFDVEQIKEAPSEGLYASGLAMEGCAWSVKELKLVEAPPKALLTPAPILFISACHMNDLPAGRDTATAASAAGRKEAVVNTTYECPIYVKQKRSSAALLATVAMKSDDPASKWTLRGAAIVPLRE